MAVDRTALAQLIATVRSDPSRSRDWQALQLCDAAEALQAEVDAVVKVVDPPPSPVEPQT